MDGSKNNMVCIRLDAESKQRLLAASKETGTSMSNLIRLCVRAELKNISKRYGMGKHTG